MDRNNILLRGILRYPFFMPAVGSTVWQQGAFQAVRLRAQILRRHTDLGAKAGRCVPRPVRIVEYRAGEGDQVGIAILQRRFRLLRVGDQPTPITGMATCWRISRAKGNWYPGPTVIACCGDKPPLET